METFSKDLHKTVEAWIISSDEGKVMEITGMAGGEVKVMESSG